MKRLSSCILQIALPALAFSTVFLSEPVAADSIIRISGDRAVKDLGSSGSQLEAKPSFPTSSGSTTIRIIGDKPSSAQAPASEQKAHPEPSRNASKINEIRIIGDKKETVQKVAPLQPGNKAVTEKEEKEKAAREKDILAKEAAAKAEKEQKDKSAREEERLAKEAAAKVEKEQKEKAAREEAKLAKETAEKAEKERLAKIKAEQEKIAAEVAQQEAIKLEQKLFAARKAEELRKAAEKAEQDRISALNADEERLTAARKALVEKLRTEVDSESKKTGSNGTSADSAATAINGHSNSNSSPESENGTAPATIWDLYLAAKAIDPALGRTEARVTGSKADSDLLLAGLMPHLNSTVGVKQISQTLTNYAPDEANYNFTALNYNVTAQMTLLHVPTLYSMAAAAAALSGEQAGVAAARQNLIVKVADSYFALLKAQTDKQIALGEINRLKQVLDQSQAFLKAGTGDVIAVYEAQSRLDGAGADLTKSESALRLAEQKLSSLTGKPVSSVVNYLPQTPAGPDPDNIDWWVATMEKEQPAIRQAREGLTQTSEQRKAVKAEYFPILQASGGYDVNRGAAALPTAEVRQWFVGASISLPLYSGGETAAKVRRAIASEEERRHIFDETMDQQRENVKQAYFNLRYNISLIKALDQRKASSEIQLAAVKKGRKIGTRNAIDVLNAEQTYSMALRDYRNSLYDNIIRLIQLKSAAGILAETDVSELSRIEAPAPENGLNMIISRVSK